MINNNQTLKPGPNKSRLNCEHNLLQGIPSRAHLIYKLIIDFLCRLKYYYYLCIVLNNKSINKLNFYNYANN